MPQYRSNGKLLLFGEYVVLDGALALAIPTKKGQTLTVEEEPFLLRGLNWKSYDHEGRLWFEVFFDQYLNIPHSTDADIARTLQTILFQAQELNPEFLKKECYYDVQTHLEFPNDWGLGSSSTLIADIAQWAGVDAFSLFFGSFAGSGYDIACAISDKPLLYQLFEEKPNWTKVDFNPPFKDNIYFIHLGKKQNSREGIARYKSRKADGRLVNEISDITENALACTDSNSFCKLIDEHENLLADALQLEKVKDLYFRDFSGSIKSLGAWGGDFVMAVSELPQSDVKEYFAGKGFATVISHCEMFNC